VSQIEKEHAQHTKEEAGDAEALHLLDQNQPALKIFDLLADDFALLANLFVLCMQIPD
jgi:hypothetical protein